MKRIQVIILVFSLTVLYAQNKTTIAVLGLDAVGISKSEAQVLSNRIRSLLVNASYFRVLERANMEAILIEQGFQQSGCTSDECLVEAGQLLGVQKMLAGSVGKFGSVYTIELRIIDVESGKIESSASYDYQGQMENLLLEGAPVALTKVIQKDKAMTAKENAVVGYLRVETDVADAEIRVDSERRGRGQTDLLILQAGSHQLSIDHDFYLPFDDRITLTAGDTILRRVHLMRAEGFLTLSGKPAQASYHAADLQGTVTANERLLLPAGRMRLTLFAPYYYPLDKDLLVKRDTTISINFVLNYGADHLQNRQDWHQRLLTGSLTGAGLTIASALLANMYYGKYEKASSSDDATHYKNLTQTFDQTTKILTGLTVTVSAITMWNWIKTNNLKKELHVP